MEKGFRREKVEVLRGGGERMVGEVKWDGVNWGELMRESEA